METLKNQWKPFLAWFLVFGVIWGVNHYLGTNIPAPEPPFATGWQADPAAVEEVSAGLQFRVFSDTPAGQSDDPLPTHFYLWEIYRKIDPDGPPAKNQNPIGSCVSFGTNNAIIRTMAADIVVNQKAFELKDIVEEVTYAGSRVEIGGGRISGDGSVGAWAAKFVKEYGIIARGSYTTKTGKVYDLSTYDPARCRAWGKTGVPDDLEGFAREHPVQAVTRITSWAEAKRALSQGYGIAICSNQGFSMRRDSRGVAAVQGNWAHCMCLDGFHGEGPAEFGHIENSWGAGAHTGPVGWGNPSTAGFWASSAVISRMIAAGDTWAFSGVSGFRARKLDWFTQDTRPSPALASTGRVGHAAYRTRAYVAVDGLALLSP